MRSPSLLELAIIWGIRLVSCVALLGLARKGLYKRILFVGPYLLVAVLADLLIEFWPARFYTKSFWFFKEIAANAVLLLLAFELGARIFRAFPGARSTARFVVAIVMIATAVAVLPVWPGDGQVSEAAVLLQTRFLNGSVWLYSALAAVILWYRLPINSVQKAVLVGFVPYLLAQTVGLNFLQSYTSAETWASIRPSVNNAMAFAYFILVSYWSYVIWKPSTENILPPHRSPAANNATLPL